MSQIWCPSKLGRLFTSAEDWCLSMQGEEFHLVIRGKKLKGPLLDLETLDIKRGILWSSLSVRLPHGEVLLKGISNLAAKQLRADINSSVKAIRYRMRVEGLLASFMHEIQPVKEWADKVWRTSEVQLRAKGWLTQEFKAQINRIKPIGLAPLLTEPEVRRHIATQPEAVQDAIELWTKNFDDVANGINERHLENQKIVLKEFFEHVEKSPLTLEQIEAVVHLENRLLLVAAAGSGKTSTMVAKAGYVLKKGYFAPERILLLAFNSDAAAELRERIKARLEPLGLPADKVIARTFHAFGLDVIGAATGKRPSLAPWVENGRDLEALLEIVDELKDKDSTFRTNWDLFRIVIGHDLPKFGSEEESPDSWNKKSGTAGFWTLNNEVVKSRGELLIANWLFYNGVSYQYEAPYEHETADATHRQYRPDFYLPDIGAYLEHWALDATGEPPKEFVGYKEGMVWKKSIHAKYRTTLLETTMAGLWSGHAFAYLANELTQRGIVLDPNPERKVPGRSPIENPRLAQTFRSFLTHYKSNQLSINKLEERLHTGVAGIFRYRHAVFLKLFEKIYSAWEEKLAHHKCIDFDDMLNLASDCLSQGKWKSPYELVMVDEYQDVSHARARLVAELVKGPSKCLFAVGDDWQSINRFAGADLGVMTNFNQMFANATTLKLQTTFRCPQSLCDISSGFVQKNPRQIKKQVKAFGKDVAEPVQIVSVEDEDQIGTAIGKCVEDIVAKSDIRNRKIQIYVLGRYRKESMYMPTYYDLERVNVKFMTVHSSKGLEADYVILPRVTSESLGFPSRIIDDPVLQLAMPGGDDHEYAEERRLFYVALTRARKTVTLITLARRESPFVAELSKQYDLMVRDFNGAEKSNEVCPKCQSGFLQIKKGKYGTFMGCSRFPKCRHTQKMSMHLDCK